MPKKQWPPSYGIKTFMPHGLLAQTLHPFLPREEKAD
jgi:hypothetical protein